MQTTQVNRANRYTRDRWTYFRKTNKKPFSLNLCNMCEDAMKDTCRPKSKGLTSNQNRVPYGGCCGGGGGGGGGE